MYERERERESHTHTLHIQYCNYDYCTEFKQMLLFIYVILFQRLF